MSFIDHIASDLSTMLNGDFSTPIILANAGNTQTVCGIFDDKYTFVDPKTNEQVLTEDAALTLFLGGLTVDVNNRSTVFTINAIDYKPFDWRDNCDGSMTVYLTKI